MSEILALALGGFLLLVGVTHFVVPRYYDGLVPPWLPAARAWVLASGGAEILLGAGLLLEAARAPSAWATTALMGVYVATHLDALARARRTARRWLDRPAGAVARVLVNLVYLLWAGAVAVNV